MSPINDDELRACRNNVMFKLKKIGYLWYYEALISYVIPFQLQRAYVFNSKQ